MIYPIVILFMWSLGWSTTHAHSELAPMIQKASAEYFLCMDGGGTKTSICLLDKKGDVLPLQYRQEKASRELMGASSNITIIGVDGVGAFAKDIFTNTKVQINGTWQNLSTILDKCFIIAGFAGVTGRIAETITAIDNQRPHRPEFALTYVQMDMDIFTMVAPNGVFLIAGTGSIGVCKIDGHVKSRSGGDHWLLGSDQGSAVAIGQDSIRAALSIERDTLLPHERKTFATKDKDVFQKAVLGFEGYREMNCSTALELRTKILSDLKTMNVKKLTDITSLVFDLAYDHGNAVARVVVKRAAHNLREIIDRCASLMPPARPLPIYLYGGVFKAKQASQFIKDMGLMTDQFIVHNLARENVAIKVLKPILQSL